MAAVAQAGFFIFAFFDIQFAEWVFPLATGITAIQLLEEIVLVIVLPEWKTDVKDLYWVWRLRNGIHSF